MDGEQAKIDPCWSMKKCQNRKCVAHGKETNCWATPQAGYNGKFCDGPMCPRLKNMVCPSCPVAKQWGLAELLGTSTESDIKRSIAEGKITVKRLDSDKS